MRPRELWLLLAVLGVLLAGVVAIPSVGDRAEDEKPTGRPITSAGPSPTLSTPSPVTTPGALRIDGVRASSFAAGSGQVGVHLVARVPGETVTAAQVEGQSPLTVGAAGEISGTVRVTCASRRTPVVLVVTTDTGRTLTTSLVLPSAAVDRACAAPAPGTPMPTASTKGS